MINENAIKLLVQTAGWKEAEKMFIDEIVYNSLPKNFATKGKSIEEIALECKAREMASNMVTTVLDRIKNIANKTVFVAETWE